MQTKIALLNITMHLHLNLSAEQQWGNIGGVDRLGIAVSIVPTNSDIVLQNGNVNRSISVSIPIEVTI